MNPKATEAAMICKIIEMIRAINLTIRNDNFFQK
jgi:hypothetical protein